MSKRGKILAVLKLYGFPVASFTSSIVVSSSVVEVFDRLVRDYCLNESAHYLAASSLRQLAMRN